MAQLAAASKRYNGNEFALLVAILVFFMSLPLTTSPYNYALPVRSWWSAFGGSRHGLSLKASLLADAKKLRS